MDLTDLYHRHGISLMMSDNAACEPSRQAHRVMAGEYARRIADKVRAPALAVV